MDRLTIDEAIEHAREVARVNREDAKYAIKNKLHDDVIKTCTECAEEHEQLVKWLEELKEYKQLEEQGLLIKLPCEIGSKVYSICTGVMIEFEMTLELYAKRHDMFGITMFTTKEGAEQGLKDWRNKLCNI